MQYFKVVRRTEDGKYVSAFAKGMSAVEYGTDILTRQPEWLNGTEFGLTVFNSLDKAINYKASMEFLEMGTFIVFHALVEIPVYGPPGSVIKGWDLSSGYIIKRKGSWPEGTVMTNGVVLLEEVA